jgi:hypothetical protein
MSLDVERLWDRRAELKAVHKGPASLRPRCDGVVAVTAIQFYSMEQSRWEVVDYRQLSDKIMSRKYSSPMLKVCVIL